MARARRKAVEGRRRGGDRRNGVKQDLGRQQPRLGVREVELVFALGIGRRTQLISAALQDRPDQLFEVIAISDEFRRQGLKQLARCKRGLVAEVVDRLDDAAFST